MDTTNGNLQARLAGIEDWLRRLDAKMERSVQIAERVARLESGLDDTRHRIEANEAEHRQILAQLRTLSWRVALIVGSAAGAIQLLLRFVEHVK